MLEMKIKAAPKLKHAFAFDSVTIIAVFDEPVDSLQGATIGNYHIDGGLSVINAITMAPLFQYNTIDIKQSTITRPGLYPDRKQCDRL